MLLAHPEPRGVAIVLPDLHHTAHIQRQAHRAPSVPLLPSNNNQDDTNR